jgi:hypothetical protein
MLLLALRGCGDGDELLLVHDGQRDDAAGRRSAGEARVRVERHEEARKRAIEERAKQLQVAAEQKAARDARYAARKARKK